MLYLALFPPMWFYIMDPRAKSISDAKKGIPNKDQWNLIMPPSDDDKKRAKVAKAFFVIVSLIFTYTAFNRYLI